MSPLKLTKIAVDLPRPILDDISGSIERQFKAQAEALRLQMKPQASIAVAVGSRGIANLSQIVGTTIQQLKELNTQPFIVPAMGSHGGATDQGQAEVLRSYGITEAAMGCEIRSSMETVELDQEDLPVSAYMDRLAYQADGIVVINRIKPHTDFHGKYESGLMKMIVIGLGKERQAFEMHRHGVYGLKELVPQTAKRVIEMGKITLGVGIVENAYDETAIVEVIPGDEIAEREAALLKIAHTNLPRLPIKNLDVLAVDRLGKDISGTGLDTNVIGRIRIPTEKEPLEPRIKTIYVSELTPASHGNATGMGLADVITERFRSQIDFESTYKNIVTSGFLERAKQPIVAPTDQAAFELCYRAAGPIPMESLRVVRIQDTLHVNELYVSASVLEEIEAGSEAHTLQPSGAAFDPNGTAYPF